MTTYDLDNLSLGKSVHYIDTYSPDLLDSVPRSLNRDKLDLSPTALPFFGEDLWTGYELSWLNPKGKPQIALLTCQVPYDSPNIVESKSFKLYLNSFNQSKFTSRTEVEHTLTQDLSACAGKAVKVKVLLPSTEQFALAALPGENIDDLDIDVTDYSVNAGLLSTRETWTETTLNSHLLKSNCLVTGQPDWASIVIRYVGPTIIPTSLLQYLISYRQHNEFHEQCVERIFMDILSNCQPEKLTVYARFTRRGGLDINPFRSNFEMPVSNFRTVRQ